MDDLKRLAQQFTQAANVAGPASSIPEMTNYFKSAFVAPIVKQGIGAGGALAGQKAKEADEADEMARKAAIQKLQDQMDPGKYRKDRKADGGFSFFDPSGKEIDINTYAERTGTRRVDILKDSENPIDQEYINDWSNMNELAQAFYNNDEATKQQYLQSNPGLANRTPAEFMGELIRKYPHIYGRGGTGAEAYQQTLKNRGKAIFAPAPSGGGGAGGGRGLRFD